MYTCIIRLSGGAIIFKTVRNENSQKTMTVPIDTLPHASATAAPLPVRSVVHSTCRYRWRRRRHSRLVRARRQYLRCTCAASVARTWIIRYGLFANGYTECMCLKAEFWILEKKRTFLKNVLSYVPIWE